MKKRLMFQQIISDTQNLIRMNFFLIHNLSSMFSSILIISFIFSIQ